jgi:ribosomal protein S18 acetylase RimI-like enzyme
MIVVALSQEHLAETITLVQNVFTLEASLPTPPETALRVSLAGDRKKELLQRLGIRQLAYFVALDDATKAVRGVIGQYEEEGDPPNLVWVGWFCVDPAFRGQHLGEALLLWNMHDAKRKGYTRMKLYTTDHPSMKAAQGLYENLGFAVTHVQPIENTNYIMDPRIWTKKEPEIRYTKA